MDISSSMTNQKILILDDDTIFRASLRVFLENQNYKVYEATSVKEAIKHDLQTFNAIVSDGRTNSRIIKRAPGIPVIITSVHASLRSAIEMMKQGAADYLPKP